MMTVIPDFVALITALNIQERGICVVNLTVEPNLKVNSQVTKIQNSISI